jgi:hypothetical protein
VYLTAFALDAGESIGMLLGSLPRVSVALNDAIRPLDNGTSVLDPDTAVPALYGACPPAVAAASVARLSAQPFATFGQPVTGAAREGVPSTYVVCTEDRAIAVEHQQAMATRCDTVVTLHTDHSPFVSMVGDTADAIEAALARS